MMIKQNLNNLDSTEDIDKLQLPKSMHSPGCDILRNFALVFVLQKPKNTPFQ